MAAGRVSGAGDLGRVVSVRVLDPFVDCGNLDAMYSGPVIPRILRLISSGVLAFAIATSSFLTLPSTAVSAQIFHDPRRKNTVGFSVDLDVAPETLTKVVKAVAGDTVIRGTFIYSKESEIDD